METCVRHNDSLRKFHPNSGVSNNEWSCKERNMHISEHLTMHLSQKENQLKMIAGSLYLPKENDKNPQGEDAHFICAEKQTIGIADGVGGWSKLGVDSGVYARQLMTNSFIFTHNQAQGMIDPAHVLSKAYYHTNVEGSSTACILTLNENIIHAVNIGDSGFLVVRGGKVVYRSPIQQRSFNCPYQLGQCKDSPSEAQILKVKVEQGDVIVAGTDGLFDNMHEAEIEEIITRRIREGETPEQLALWLANFALYNSFDRYANTPFSIASKKAGKPHSGGKVDDITVVVAVVVQNQK